MTKTEALKKAKSMWGWSAGAFRRRSPNRLERYMVCFISGYDAAHSEPMGWAGGSFEEAFAKAEQAEEAGKQQAAMNKALNVVAESLNKKEE